jgi:hypothetical protein
MGNNQCSIASGRGFRDSYRSSCTQTREEFGEPQSAFILVWDAQSVFGKAYHCHRAKLAGDICDIG